MARVTFSGTFDLDLDDGEAQFMVQETEKYLQFLIDKAHQVSPLKARVTALAKRLEIEREVFIEGQIRLKQVEDAIAVITDALQSVVAAHDLDNRTMAKVQVATIAKEVQRYLDDHLDSTDTV